MMKERMTATRVSIVDIVKGTFGKDDGDRVISPDGIELRRVMIVGHIVGQLTGKDNFASITIDDGTGTIRAKAWGNEAASLQEVEENILALVIGKVKEYNDEIYLVPEIIRSLPDSNFLTLHKLERHYHIVQHGGEPIPTSASLEDHYETSKATSDRAKPKGLGGKILDYIQKNDTSQGIAIADIAKYFAKEDKTDIQLEVIELQADNWIREERTGVYRFSD
ncbi:MAG: hypothetical protein ACTSV2_02680 [Candidatus Thorarchaeota archaeon]